MAGPIYKMFHARWTEAWYQLSQEQRDAIFQQMAETAERLGVKSTLVCDSSWNSERWLFWGVEEYPDGALSLQFISSPADSSLHDIGNRHPESLTVGFLPELLIMDPESGVRHRPP